MAPSPSSVANSEARTPMGNTIRRFFGKRTRQEKWAQIDAERAQAQQARAAEEEAQRNRAERAASGRLLRGAGRRALSFQGRETGLAPTLGG